MSKSREASACHLAVLYEAVPSGLMAAVALSGSLSQRGWPKTPVFSLCASFMKKNMKRIHHSQGNRLSLKTAIGYSNLHEWGECLDLVLEGDMCQISQNWRRKKATVSQSQGSHMCMSSII